MTTIRPVNLRAYETAINVRAAELGTLIALVTGVGRGPDDELDMLGHLRLIELQTQGVRRALVSEAYAAGYTTQEIADTLALSVTAFEKRYGRDTR